MNSIWRYHSFHSLIPEVTACREEYIDPFMTVLVADARANILDSRDTPGPQNVSCPSKLPGTSWHLFERLLNDPIKLILCYELFAYQLVRVVFLCSSPGILPLSDAPPM